MEYVKSENAGLQPAVYINGEFIGGSDIMANMHESGELQQLLKPE